MALTWDKNLRNRLIVTIIGAPSLLYIAHKGGYYFLGLIGIIILIGLYEMNLMGRAMKFNSLLPISLIFGLLFTADSYFNAAENFSDLILIYLMTACLRMIFIKGEMRLRAVSFDVFSFLYVVLFLTTAILIREMEFASGYEIGGKFAVTMLLMVWFLDTIAYATGRMFGKKKLFPRVSPKKTIAGGVGGFLACVALTITASYTYFTELALVHAIVLGILVGIVGQVGDFVESFFKRRSDTKDSSAILPGHGGILDRFDSFVFISPMMYMYIKYFLINI